PEITEDDARHAMKMGFGGKMAIHPRQIEPIRSGFRPSDNDITWARDIVGAASSGEASQVNGEMVDRPVIERARQVLRRAALV
ncbi:CoA ester lyase, partial [Mesorhizobium sp. M7A.F.Ca.CA.002.05.1.1]